jgi:hypothetical protein
MLHREIFAVRAIGWLLLALSVFDFAMRWARSDVAHGLALPPSDAVLYGLVAAVGFELSGRALARLARSASGGAER